MTAPDTTAPTRYRPHGGSPRVAILSDAAPERNGVGAYYRDLAEHLRTTGATVELFAPHYHAGVWSGGPSLPLPGDATQRLVFPALTTLHQRLRALRPETIVVPTPGPFGLFGLYMSRRLGTSLISGFHTDFEALTELFQDWGWRARIANGYLRAAHRLLFRHSQLVLANSPRMVELANAHGAREAGLMATPIARDFLERPPAPPRTRFERILFAGRLAPEKNLEAIVAAARQLPELHFTIVGDGPQRDWLHAQQHQTANLELLGWLGRTQVLELIDNIDALVLPSRVESFGTIALEAMARARPVLVSSACGIASWNTLREGIYPIQPGETLAERLSQVRAMDPALRTRKALAARSAAQTINERNLRHWLAMLGGDHRRTLNEH